MNQCVIASAARQSTQAPAVAVASNWVVGLDTFLFVFILAPLYPPALSRPAGREREPTATFGRVNRQKKYRCRGTLKTKIDFGIGNSVFCIGCSGFPAVEAGLSSAGARGSETKMFEPAGRVSESPPRHEQRKVPRSGPDFGCLFFRFPFFGHAKKGNSPAGARPGLPRAVERTTRHNACLPGRNPACRAGISHIIRKISHDKNTNTWIATPRSQ